MKSDFLFVYGTLMSSSTHHVAIRLRNHATMLGEASIIGRLYDVGEYPAYLNTKDTDELVYGQLLLLHSDEIIDELDEYEGVPSLYTRMMTTCIIYGHSIEAWVYKYEGQIDDSRLIENGRYTN